MTKDKKYDYICWNCGHEYQYHKKVSACPKCKWTNKPEEE